MVFCGLILSSATVSFFFFIFVPKAYAIKKKFLQRLWQIVFSLNKN